MVALLPQVAKQTCFALKGGTAINLFIRDMPRLSVDIDLAYLPVEDRQTSLTNIDKALEAIATDIEQIIVGASVRTSSLKTRGKPGEKITTRSMIMISALMPTGSHHLTGSLSLFSILAPYLWAFPMILQNLPWTASSNG
jgi:predicted nucleotidyltransferase component of viral defense system